MNKLFIALAICLVANVTCSIDEKWKTTSSNKTDMQTKQETFCTPIVRNVEQVATRLQMCLRQKRQEKLTSSSNRKVRSANREAENKINVDQLFKTLSELTGDLIPSVGELIKDTAKLNIKSQIAEVVKIVGEKQDESYTLQCQKPNTIIKIVSSRLSSQIYQLSCSNQTKSYLNEMLNDLNEECNENLKTKIKTSQICDGKSQCKINLNTDFTGVCDCTQYKYLNVEYECVEGETINKESNGRSKRALHYRNRPREIFRERQLRERLARINGLDYMLDALNYPYDYYGDYYYDNSYALPIFG